MGNSEKEEVQRHDTMTIGKMIVNEVVNNNQDARSNLVSLCYLDDFTFVYSQARIFK